MRNAVWAGTAWVAAGCLLAACVGDSPGSDGTSSGGSSDRDAAASSSGAPSSSGNGSTSSSGGSSGASSSSGTGGSSSSGDLDASTDASTGRCDPAKDFSTPVPEPVVNNGDSEGSFALTRDELTAVMHRNSGSAELKLFMAKRASTSENFSIPSMVGLESINSGASPNLVGSPSFSPTGQFLYFGRQRGAVLTMEVAELAAGNTSFSAPVVITYSSGGFLTPFDPTISPSGQTLYALQTGQGNFNLLAADRGQQASQFGALRTFTTGPAQHGVLTADELTLYYQNNASEIMRVTRTAASLAFDTSTGSPVASLNSAGDDFPLWLSADGCVMYLGSTRIGGSGGADVWRAQRPL